jgi:hypothetical protein
MSKLFPARACMINVQCAETLTWALNNMSSLMGGLTNPTDCFMGAKVRKTPSWPRSRPNFSIF